MLVGGGEALVRGASGIALLAQVPPRVTRCPNERSE